MTKKQPGQIKKNTCRRTIMVRHSEAEFKWGEAQHAVQNRDQWREIIVASCPTRDEEDEVSKEWSDLIDFNNWPSYLSRVMHFSILTTYLLDKVLLS